MRSKLVGQSFDIKRIGPCVEGELQHCSSYSLLLETSLPTIHYSYKFTMTSNEDSNGGENTLASYETSTQNQLISTPDNHSGNTTGPDLSTSSLNALQSREQQQLLNEIDKLRAYGISDIISLPQLVVCGDQSSGKSSVLEAITEVPFPRKDNLCTRFATELVLRRSPQKKVLVKILPGNHRNEAEREALALFTQTIDDFSELPALMESATAQMGIKPSSSSFSRDVLSIEISGPNRPQLTIVDLPGLIHTANKAQTREDVELVSELCSTYILNPRTIILAVVTAKNDYANQIILKRARDVDPDGNRTLGIITKPDTLPAGSESEGDFVGLAKNEDINFRLGWHVMRNRGFETREDSFAERNRAEEAFFNQGIWKTFPRESVGVTSLRSRLSNLLLDHIRLELPKVFVEIKAKLRDCEEQLAVLGEKRTTTGEQRLFLSKLSQAFYGLCKAAIDGLYEDKFFGDALSDDGYEKRLRAIIQNSNLSFAKTMRLKGHRMQIISDEDAVNPPGNPQKPSRKSSPKKISRTDALDWVKTILARSRGRELPGTFNPLLIGELFWDQSTKWEALAQKHVDEIWEACQTFVRRTLRELTNGEVFDSLFTFYIDNMMEARLRDAKLELQRLLNDRRRHAMTYNHYYTDEVQKAREERRQDSSKKILENLGLHNQTLPETLYLNTQGLLSAIASPSAQSSQSMEPDMDMFACQEVLDCMSSYYKARFPSRYVLLECANTYPQVSLKTFVDNVASQIIERRIVGDLWEIFSPVSVASMDVKTIADIASESPEIQSKRVQLELQQERLRKGLTACRNALSGFKSSARPPASKCTCAILRSGFGKTNVSPPGLANGGDSTVSNSKKTKLRFGGSELRWRSQDTGSDPDSEQDDTEDTGSESLGI